MITYTNGPWFDIADASDEASGTIRLKTDNGWTDATEEDISLMMLAPELLEALENLENDNGSIPSHAWEMIQAVIGKARGQK